MCSLNLVAGTLLQLRCFFVTTDEQTLLNFLVITLKSEISNGQTQQSQEFKQGEKVWVATTSKYGKPSFWILVVICVLIYYKYEYFDPFILIYKYSVLNLFQSTSAPSFTILIGNDGSQQTGESDIPVVTGYQPVRQNRYCYYYYYY